MCESTLHSNTVSAKCIACKQDIPEDASICVHCSSYQKAWRRELKYWASVAALLIAGASLILWSISTFPHVRKVLFWNDDVRIVGLSSVGPTIVGNFGDGPVYLSHVLIYSPKISPKYKQTASRIEFFELLQPDDFAKKPTKKNDWGKILFVSSSKYSEKERNEIIEKAVREKECYRIAFFDKDDPFYKDTQEQGTDILSKNTSGYIAYYTSRNDHVTLKPIEVIASVVQKEIHSCNEGKRQKNSD